MLGGANHPPARWEDGARPGLRWGGNGAAREPGPFLGPQLPCDRRFLRVVSPGPRGSAITSPLTRFPDGDSEARRGQPAEPDPVEPPVPTHSCPVWGEALAATTEGLPGLTCSRQGGDQWTKTPKTKAACGDLC